MSINLGKALIALLIVVTALLIILAAEFNSSISYLDPTPKSLPKYKSIYIELVYSGLTIVGFCWIAIFAHTIFRGKDRTS